MKTFRASTELVDLLLQNGFSEETGSYFPEHFTRMKEVGYDPKKVKRKFAYSSRRDYIIFNYQDISFVHTYSDIASGVELEEKEIRSALAFYKLSDKERKEYLSTYRNVTDFSLHYQKIKERKEDQRTRLEKKILQAYEGVLFQ